MKKDSGEKKMIKVSVIMPIYNKENHLRETIESVMQQSLKEIEIILINDGSTDRSLEICQYYKKRDSRIRVVDQKNQGVSFARNQGILCAAGDYIGFIDADDTIDKDMYLNMYNQCINDNSDVCMCNYVEYNKSMKKMYSTICIDPQLKKQEEIINRVVADMIAPSAFDNKSPVIMGSVCRFLIKKDVLMKESIRFVQGIPLMEDLIFCVDLLTSVDTLSIDHSHYYHYYSVENSASKKYRKNYQDNSIRVTRHLIDILLKKNKYLLFEERLNNRFFLTTMGSIVNTVNLNNKSSMLEKLRDIRRICSEPELKVAMSKINKRHFSKKIRFKFYSIYNNKVVILYIYHVIVNKKNEVFNKWKNHNINSIYK